MTDTQDLIARLRTDPAMDNTTLGNEAADALDAAQAEIERLTKRVTDLGEYEGVGIARVLNERDAALARLAELEKQEPIRYWVNGANTYDNESVAKDWAAAFKSEVVPLYAAAGASPAQPSQAGELSDAEALNFMEHDRGERVLSIGSGWYSRSSYGKPLKRFDKLRCAIIAAINAKGVA